MDAHYRGLYWFALSLSDNPADAADLTQQTFYRWAQHGHALREPGAAKAWLFRTLYREFLRLRKRSSREVPLPDEEMPAPGDDTEVLERCDTPALLGALRSLPPDHAAVVSMYYLKDFSYHQIAGVLGVPVGTIMSRLARAKTALRRLLTVAESTAPNTGGGDVIPFPKQRHG